METRHRNRQRPAITAESRIERAIQIQTHQFKTIILIINRNNQLPIAQCKNLPGLALLDPFDHSIAAGETGVDLSLRVQLDDIRAPFFAIFIDREISIARDGHADDEKIAGDKIVVTVAEEALVDFAIAVDADEAALGLAGIEIAAIDGHIDSTRKIEHDRISREFTWHRRFGVEIDLRDSRLSEFSIQQTVGSESLNILPDQPR